ncbi:MAG: hydantoinase/carbamoylase family amidase [Solirubrobacteraceae bacterium]
MPDPARIAARLDALWEIALGGGGGADRPAFSAAEAEAMRLVAGWAQEAGLEPTLDPFGNLWALPAGFDGPVVTAGSHVDTVPDGGRYDGALGTVLGLELASDLPACGLLVCVAEEAPRFGAGTIGSRLLVGTLAPADLDGFRDARGVSAADAQGSYLEALSELARGMPAPERIRAHAEIHVAQRRDLREIGMVSRVAAPRRLEVVITGQAGHSGEVSMAERHDALAAAAELVLAVEAAARDEAADTMATVGTLTVSPGAMSVVPGKATLGIDARSTSAAALDRLEAAVRARAASIAAARIVQADVRLVRGGPPTQLDCDLVASALSAAGHAGVPAVETWSGAGHDAQHLAALMPTLLLFVPLHGGESHTPFEDASMDEILAATAIAAEVLGGELERGRGSDKGHG